MIRNMIRLSLWGVQSRSREIIGELHRLGVLHLEHGSPRGGEETERLNSLRFLRGKILGLIESLEWDKWNAVTEDELLEAEKFFSGLPSEELVPEIDRSLEEFGRRLAALQEEKTQCVENLGKAKKARDSIERFGAFFRRSEDGLQPVSIWWIPESSLQKALAEVNAEFHKAGEAGESHHFLPGRDSLGILALRVPGSCEETVFAVLSKWKGLPWRLPDFCGEIRPEESLPFLVKKTEEFSARIETITSDISRTSAEWGPRLASLFLFIDELTEQASVEACLETGRDFFSLQGWMPEDALGAASARLKEKFGDDVLLQWRSPGEDEWSSVPTALMNRPMSAPFELFLKLLRPPSYSGFDPTTAVALFFPFFSGCMIGDMGYGLIILLLSIRLKKGKSPLVRDIGAILFSMSLWSLVWGAVWGEFFGDVGHRLFHLEPLWVERSVSVMPVVVFTIALGAAHVFFGLLIGVYQGVKNRHRHQWMEKAGNLAVLLSLVGALVVMKQELPGSFFTLPVSLLVVGLVLLIGGGGIGGIIETLGSFGNIISYVRIAAIGLSSAILALVASKFMDVFGLSVFGIFLALMIHLLNFVLAIGGSGLHSARLHYVEFFGKFYSGNGKEYKPFQRRSGFSWKKHS